MLSAHECLAKAAELSAAADRLGSSLHREGFLRMAETWVDLSRMAEYQDHITTLAEQSD